MSQIKFGTDGWRAIIARDFTFRNCRIVAQGVAAYINSKNLSKKGIIIGYDTRFLSRDFAEECARVMVGNGIKTILLKKFTPTPLTAYAIYKMEAGGALMITASHNPPEYSGIKFIPDYAGPALPDVTDAIEEEIRRVIDNQKIYELDLGEAVKLGLFMEKDLDAEYMDQVVKLTQLASIKSRKLKIVINPMFGAGIGYLDKILGDLGYEVKTINNHRDVLFGGSMPEPINRLLNDLKRAVISYNGDIGLALDGDADRFGIVDNQGNFINANRFMNLLLDHLINSRKWRGPVCRSVATTHMFDSIARQHGMNVIETPVGFKYVSEAMREKGCIMGCEESGGISIAGHVPEKDGILACLLAVEMLACNDKSLHELNAEFDNKYGPAPISERIDIKINQADINKILKKVYAFEPDVLAGIRINNISDPDGRRIMLEDGSWLLIRTSGTEPILRIYVEAADEELISALKQEVFNYLGLINSNK
jgi:alpha-D-glucose phosphate-specific phosphoglucomutase